MRPLAANPQRKSDAATFHRRVVKKHGRRCHFCGREPETIDAMHIVKRSHLGKHRYACPEENGRPGCRHCHNMQETGQIEFRLVDRVNAVKALNTVLKIPLPIPVD